MSNDSEPTVPLSPQQEDFCRHYVLDPCGKRAAVKAGYAPGSAHVQAHRLLRNDKIQSRISACRAEVRVRHCLDVDDFMAKLEGIYLRAFENYQMHAAVRAVEVQARLAGVLLDRSALGESRFHALNENNPAARPAVRLIEAAPARGKGAVEPSTPAPDGGNVKD